MRIGKLRVAPAARWTLAASLWVMLACGGDGASPTSPAIANVALTFPGATLSLAATQPLTPVFTDKAGTVLGHITGASWTSSNSAIASVDQFGNVRGESLGGPVTITVALGAKSASASVTVVPDHVAIAPTSGSLVVNQSRQLSGAPVDFNGVPIPSAAGPVTWVSSDAAVATVGATTGLVTGISSGNATILASAAGKTTGLALEVGVPSVYDGAWVGVSNCATCSPARTYPVIFEVLFGKLRSFALTINNSPGAICAFSLSTVQTTGAVVSNGTVALTLAAPAGVAVTGTFDSPTTMSGTHGAIFLGAGCSAPAGSGFTILNASVPSESFTATRQ